MSAGAFLCGPAEPTADDLAAVDAFAARLAGLTELHKSPGRRRAEQLAAAARCTELVAGVACGAAGELLPRGVRCAEHRAAVPDPVASLPPASPARAPREYGRATTDPLGREGPGWAVSKTTLLPVRVADDG